MLRLFLGLFIVAGVVGSDDYAFANSTEPNELYINIILAIVGLFLMFTGANRVCKNHG
jgi:hypothetical protein